MAIVAPVTASDPSLRYYYDWDKLIGTNPLVLGWYVADPKWVRRNSQGRVTTWRDRSANGRHLVQATPGQQPLYEAGVWPNGGASVAFDQARGDHFMLPAVLPVGADAKWTIINFLRTPTNVASGGSRYVMGSDPAADDNFYLSIFGATVDPDVFRVSVGKAGINVTQARTETPYLLDTWYPLIVSWNGTTKQLAISSDGGLSWTLATVPSGAALSNIAQIALGGARTTAGGITLPATFRTSEVAIIGTDVRTVTEGQSFFLNWQKMASNRYGLALAE